MTSNDKKIISLLSRNVWVENIGQWIHNETDRMMVQRYLLDGATIEQIAEECCLSAVQTQKRLKRAKEQLFKHI